MIEVKNSSNIESYNYNAGTEILTIKFISGGVYQYHSVPPMVVAGFSDSDSKGVYFARMIKNIFPTRRIS